MGLSNLHHQNGVHLLDICVQSQCKHRVVIRLLCRILASSSYESHPRDMDRLTALQVLGHPFEEIHLSRVAKQGQLTHVACLSLVGFWEQVRIFDLRVKETWH